MRQAWHCMPAPCVRDPCRSRTPLRCPACCTQDCPCLALPRLLRNVAEDIAQRRRAETRLAEAFEPLLSLGSDHLPPAKPAEISLLKGLARIKQAVAEAMADASRELLAVQPKVGNPAARLAEGLNATKPYSTAAAPSTPSTNTRSAITPL
ncbi:hypothetical protein GCM10018780_72930 [Streptomyces lanatus]|nr:hypothetical protein GCM10018780_72930 [Streptomyces lanatus]